MINIYCALSQTVDKCWKIVMEQVQQVKILYNHISSSLTFCLNNLACFCLRMNNFQKFNLASLKGIGWGTFNSHIYQHEDTQHNYKNATLRILTLNANAVLL